MDDWSDRWPSSVIVCWHWHTFGIRSKSISVDLWRLPQLTGCKWRFGLSHSTCEAVENFDDCRLNSWRTRDTSSDPSESGKEKKRNKWIAKCAAILENAVTSKAARKANWFAVLIFFVRKTMFREPTQSAPSFSFGDRIGLRRVRLLTALAFTWITIGMVQGLASISLKGKPTSTTDNRVDLTSPFDSISHQRGVCQGHLIWTFLFDKVNLILSWH